MNRVIAIKPPIRLITIAAAALVLILVGVVLATQIASADHGNDKDHVILSGTVNLTVKSDNVPAPAGIEIFAYLEKHDNKCGDAITQEAGAYSLEIAAACADGTVSFAILATGDSADSTLSMPTESKEEDLDIVFSSLSFDVARLMPSKDVWDHIAKQQAFLRSQQASQDQRVADTTESDKGLEVIAKALSEETPSKPLIDGQSLLILLLVVVVLGILLLTIMVVGRIIGELLGATMNQSAFRQQIEGMVLVMVIVAVILLGVTEKIGEEGLVSVLAAIAGYAIGRSVSGAGSNGADGGGGGS
ncbi:MAG: hypothetical protein BZY88_17200 [SAR202 cluster bacterium Io17-Chloro-G9]|nr:MAG: hypothetical protein BZY88_17200 [SAR202 cluster bacterium Io17-Chloro-G9]